MRRSRPDSLRPRLERNSRASFASSCEISSSMRAQMGTMRLPSAFAYSLTRATRGFSMEGRSFSLTLQM